LAIAADCATESDGLQLWVLDVATMAPRSHPTAHDLVLRGVAASDVLRLTLEPAESHSGMDHQARSGHPLSVGIRKLVQVAVGAQWVRPDLGPGFVVEHQQADMRWINRCWRRYRINPPVAIWNWCRVASGQHDQQEQAPTHHGDLSAREPPEGRLTPGSYGRLGLIAMAAVSGDNLRNHLPGIGKMVLVGPLRKGSPRLQVQLHRSGNGPVVEE